MKGERHYCNTLKIKADREKNALAAKHGIKVIRFPYWIQLTDETLSHYLGLAARITQNFPHGFITTEWYPASFCELGIERFMGELESLPPRIRSAVIDSLRARSMEHGTEYVLPRSLWSLLESDAMPIV